MNKNDKASVSLIKILVISLVLIFITGIGVVATNAKITNVKIILSSNYEMTVLTAKTKVSDILEENHITIQEDEVVSPSIDSEISDNKTIKIVKASEIEQEVAEVEEVASTEQILQNYNSVVEKIVVEQVEIPFETITKEATGEGTKLNKVIQNGENGLKEVTYKVRYQDDIEIERIELSSKIIKEPVNKIVEVRTVQITSRYGDDRAAVVGTVAEYQAYARQRCYEYGWTDSDFECLVKLWNRESGWRVTATNRSSGAYGIPQSLPASKMASAGSDYLTNYKTQINWGLSYIKGRYGNPTAAWAHSQNKGWY